MLTEPLMSIPEKPRRRSAVGKSNTTLARRLLGSPAVSEFIDGVMLYVLSKEWYDAFATHIFKLHPLPYCSEDDSELPCTLEASAASQLCFAVAMLLGASVLVRLAGWFDESACAEGGGRSLSIVPPMAGMCVGWAFGFAAVKWLAELDGSMSAVCVCIPPLVVFGSASGSCTRVARRESAALQSRNERRWCRRLPTGIHTAIAQRKQTHAHVAKTETSSSLTKASSAATCNVHSVPHRQRALGTEWCGRQ
jgi:hypothetical protein